MVDHKRWTRPCVIALVTCVMGMLVTGCSNWKQADSNANGRPVVTIRVRRSAIDTPMSQTGYSHDLERACGCKIVWQEVLDQAWGPQKAPSMAANNFPDIGLALYDPQDVSRYSTRFMDLKKYLDEMPNVQTFLTQQPVARKMAVNDGKIKILPSDRGKGYRVSASHMFINKAWLDRLGLKMPRTWDELEEVLKHFLTDDPNGNGRADEIPMNIRGLGFGLWSPLVLLNSTGIPTSFMGATASSQGYYVVNGEVKSYLTSPQLRDVMKFLHKLLREGLIPKDTLTRDGAQYDAQTIGDGKTARTGVSIGWSTNSEYGSLGSEYVPLPVLKQYATDPDDKPVWDQSVTATEFAYALTVSEDAKNRKAVFKIIDRMYAPEMSVAGYFGSIPEYVKASGNTYTIDKQKAYSKYTDTRAIALQDRFAGYIPDEINIVNDTNADYVSEANRAYDDALSRVDQQKDIVPPYVRPNADDMDQLSNNNTVIFNYANNVLAKWLQYGNIDKEWRDYVKKISTSGLGMKQNIAIWQRVYDRAQKEVQ